MVWQKVFQLAKQVERLLHFFTQLHIHIYAFYIHMYILFIMFQITYMFLMIVNDIDYM